MTDHNHSNSIIKWILDNNIDIFNRFYTFIKQFLIPWHMIYIDWNLTIKSIEGFYFDNPDNKTLESFIYFILGIINFYGLDAPVNTIRGLEFLEKSIELDNIFAIYELSVIYDNGIYLSEIYDGSFNNINWSTTNEMINFVDTDIYKIINYVCLSNKSTKHKITNKNLSRHLLKNSADKGCSIAIEKYGDLLYERNIEEALKYYIIGAKNGLLYSIYQLNAIINTSDYLKNKISNYFNIETINKYSNTVNTENIKIIEKLENKIIHVNDRDKIFNLFEIFNDYNLYIENIIMNIENNYTGTEVEVLNEKLDNSNELIFKLTQDFMKLKEENEQLIIKNGQLKSDLNETDKKYNTQLEDINNKLKYYTEENLQLKQSLIEQMTENKKILNELDMIIDSIDTNQNKLNIISDFL